MLGVLYIINAIAGGDDDQEQTYPERLLEESSEGAIREVKSAFTPWGAIKIVTTLAVPSIGALGEALQPFFNLLVGVSHWDHIMLEVYSAIGAQEKEIETRKRIYKKKTIGAQFTKDALDAIPFARNINRELVVPYFEEWRNYLGVDKEYRERR